LAYDGHTEKAARQPEQLLPLRGRNGDSVQVAESTCRAAEDPRASALWKRFEESFPDANEERMFWSRPDVLNDLLLLLGRKRPELLDTANILHRPLAGRCRE
jgi:hypothetical protein